jgi:hypothetical protein
VGERMSARTPFPESRRRRRCSMGIRNAAVFPDPVRAMAATSWPPRMSGMVFRWIGVGTRYPLCRTPRYTSSHSPIDSNPPDLVFLAPPPAPDLAFFSRIGGFCTAEASITDVEGLDFLLELDLVGGRAMGGRREERCGWVLGLRYGRPWRRDSGDEGAEAGLTWAARQRQVERRWA